jgi:hypothetical protein
MYRFKLLTYVYLIFSFYLVSAQSISLTDLMDSEVVFAGEVIEESQVNGYLFIYTIDKPSGEDQRYGYRYLDRNLNPVFNGRFTASTLGSFEVAFLMNDQLVVIREYSRMEIVTDRTFIMLPLDDQKKTKEWELKDGAIMPFNVAKRKKLKGMRVPDGFYVPWYQVVRSGDTQVLLAFANYEDSRSNTEFKVFGKDFEVLFTYSLPATNKGPYSFLNLQGITANYLAFTESFMMDRKSFIKRDLLIFSTDSLRLLQRHSLEEKEKPFVHQLRFREWEGLLFQSGLYSKFDNSEYYNMKSSKGIYLKIYDTSGSVIQDKYSLWKDVGDKVNNGYSGQTLFSKYKPYLRDFQPVDKDLIFYLVQLTGQKEIPFGSRAQPIHSVVDNKNYERYSETISQVGFFLHNDLKPPTVQPLSDIEEWDSDQGIYFTQRIDNGYRYFFAMAEKSLLRKITIFGGEGSYTYYSASAEGLKSTDKFNKRSKGIQSTPSRAKDGYILLSEKDTSKKTYSLRLERLDF